MGARTIIIVDKSRIWKSCIGWCHTKVNISETVIDLRTPAVFCIGGAVKWGDVEEMVGRGEWRD